MKVSYMLMHGDLSVQSFETEDAAKQQAKEWERYHADGRRYTITVLEQPETIRDIINVCGIASKDRPLTVCGQPFRAAKVGDNINLEPIGA